MSRRFLFALSLFLALLLVPSRAFAWDFEVKGVLYSTDLDGSRVGFVVCAYNQYDAACYALGKDPNTISSAVKQKLSDSNYGGRFYDYAESFFTQSGALEDVPTWVPAYVILVSELGDLVLSDYQSVWYSTATSSLYDGAMADFVAILNGEDLGGGDDGGFVAYDCAVNSVTVDTPSIWSDETATNATFNDGVLHLTGGTTKYCRFVGRSAYKTKYRVYVPSSVDNQIRALAAGHDLIYVFEAGTFRFYYGDNLSFTYMQVDTYQHIKRYVLRGDDVYWQSFSGQAYYDGTYVFCICPSDAVISPVSLGDLNGTRDFFSRSELFAVSVGPDGNWPEPDTPVTPVEPDLPEPSSPVLEPEPDVPTVTPTWPDITINVEPAPTGTTPQDYTPWLSSILTSINSMRGELLLEFDGLVDVVRNVFNAVLNLGNVMEEHCVHIRNKLEECGVSLQNYMRSLVHWLADQLRYDADVTGDSDIFGVLSSIDSKLGGGTYEPNPLASELAYYGWNDDLWNRFLLGDNWETSVSGMTQDMGRLTTRFPFSIPWDVVALFRLFVHDPVTPVFDLPLYFSSDGYSTVHVDLSAWDSVAALVRPLVFVIFALKLALLSRDLLSGFFGGD